MNIYNAGINKEIFKDFYSESKNPKLQFNGVKHKEDVGKKVNMPIIATTIAGTLIPLLLIRKYQGKTLKANLLKGSDFISKLKIVLKSFDVKYGLKEMLLTGFGSIAGGLTGGIFFNKDESKKAKIKESVFQFINIAIPTSIVAGLEKLTEKNKNFKGFSPAITKGIIAIAVGMPTAAAISNKINNTIIDKDNTRERKLKLKDCFVHADDFISALILAQIPFANHLGKILPALYGACGYEAGIKK